MKIKRFSIILLFIFLVGSTIGCELVGYKKKYEHSIVYSGNLNGELEPCGCAVETDLGGILRRATIVDSLKSEHPNMLLISSGGLISNNSPQDKIKAKYIISGLNSMGYDAVGAQWRDLAFGNKFISESELLPWVSSNYEHEKIFSKISVHRDNNTYMIFSWMSKKDDAPMSKDAASLGKRKLNELNNSLKQAKESGALTVLLSTIDHSTAKNLFELQHVDILVVGAEDEQYVDPVLNNGVLVLQPGNRGMKLGRLSFDVDDQGKISDFDHEVIPMPDDVEDFPGLAQWYNDFNEETKQAYLDRTKLVKQSDNGSSPYFGAKWCKSCHVEEYKKWKSSKHSDAFSTLEAVNKAYDPDCIGCHTVGFEKAGGFIDPLTTVSLIDVQCESCHGASRAHAESGGQSSTGNANREKEQICTECHVGSHSPKFKYDKYWPNVVH